MAGLCGCSSRALDEAQAVVAQADSLWHIGQMYGIDEGDSATLAHAYETLSTFNSPLLSTINYQLSTVFPRSCYHYGRLLRQKDDPVSAMQVFIDATHSRTRDYHILGRVYSNMGSICHLANEFSLSYDMYQRSTDYFLKNGDTTAYYFLHNDMAYELAEQRKKDSCFAIVENIKKHYSTDSMLMAYCFMTQAQACLKCKQYDSTVYYAHLSQCLSPSLTSSKLQLAQAYSYLDRNDSAVYYAQQVLENSQALGDINNALYILTNDDETKDLDAVRQTAADRSDTQKLLEIRQGKMSQAVQLLEQDLTRKPDWKWLMGIIGTLVVTGCIIGLYVYRKGKQKTLLTQKIEHLETEYIDLQANKKNQLEQTCAVLRASDNLPSNMYWKDYEKMCCFVNEHFYLLANKLQQKNILNETEIRFCVLVLLDLNRKQISQILPYALNSVGKLKDHTAKMLGSTGKNLRHFLIEMAIKG